MSGVGGGRGRASGGPGVGAAAEPATARPVSAVLKRRLVKLVVNFLFYFRTDEAEVGAWRRGPARAGVRGARAAHPRLVCPQPVGALLLEHCRVAQEEPTGFSISECVVTPSSAPVAEPAGPRGAPPLWGRLCVPGPASPSLSPSRRTPGLPLSVGDPCSLVFPTGLSPVLSAQLCVSDAGGFSWVAWRRGLDLQEKEEL